MSTAETEDLNLLSDSSEELPLSDSDIFEIDDIGLVDEESESAEEQAPGGGLLAASAHVPRGSQQKGGYEFSAADFGLEKVLPDAKFFITPLAGNEKFSELSGMAARKFPKLLKSFATQQAVYPSIYATSLLTGMEGVFLGSDESDKPVDSIPAEIYKFGPGVTKRKEVKEVPKLVKIVAKFRLDENGHFVDSLENRKLFLLAYPSMSQRVAVLAADEERFEGYQIDREGALGN